MVYNLMLAISLVFCTSACDDEIKDDHYYQSDSALSKNLNALIANDSDLSTFYSLLKETGYDLLLNQPQAYTVWAPTNEALANVSPDVLTNPEMLLELIGNHISRYSYTSKDLGSKGILVKMFNEKYVPNSIENGIVYFDDVEVIEGDLLTNNGILHKIGAVVDVKSNIWSYLSESGEYPILVDYISQFESITFDPTVSTVIGQNTLGKNVYDSIFVTNNSFFDIIGDLNSEEERYSFVALTDEVYATAYDSYKEYFQHPSEEVVASAVNTTLFTNLNNNEFGNNQLNSTITNTIGNSVIVNASSVNEDLKLSNGNVLKVTNFDVNPEDLIYKPIRYEVENSDHRTIGDPTVFTIKKQYDITASDLFVNRVSLQENPNEDETNNYFEVSFANVLSADYDIYIKFSPVKALQDTKLKFEFSYKDADGTTVKHPIESIVVSNQEVGRIKIGDTYSNPVYVSNTDKTYFAKLKVFVDVSEAELVLYNRSFGIDYIELSPVVK